MAERERHLHLVPDPPETPATSASVARQAFSERRFHQPDDGPRRVGCRVCFRRSPVAIEYLNLVEGRVTFRCPECGGTSLVRWDDATAVGLLRPVPER